MTCRDFERWLDRGMPPGEATAARAHAGGCTRCAAALEADREIEALLGGTTPRAPAGFTERVMARVAHVPCAVVPLPAPSPLSWWIRAAAQPASLLAAVAAGVTLLGGPSLIALGEGWEEALSRAPLPGVPALPAPFDRGEVLLGIGWAALPVMAWMGWALYRWSERIALGPMARPPVGRRGPAY